MIVYGFWTDLLDSTDFFVCLDVMQDLYDYINPRNGKHSPLISKATYDIIMKNKDVCTKFYFYIFECQHLS